MSPWHERKEGSLWRAAQAGWTSSDTPERQCRDVSSRTFLTLFGLERVCVLVVWERAHDLCFCFSGGHDCCLSNGGGVALMTRLSPVSAVTAMLIMSNLLQFFLFLEFCATARQDDFSFSQTFLVLADEQATYEYGGAGESAQFIIRRAGTFRERRHGSLDFSCVLRPHRFEVDLSKEEKS